jgi:hypothetical protein
VAGNIWASGSSGHITASANISASGLLFISASQNAGQTYGVLVRDSATGRVYHTGSYGTGGGDDLGNHTATQALDMNSNSIKNVTNITASSNISASGNLQGANFHAFNTITRVGRSAGSGNTGLYQTAIGYRAGDSNQGNYQTAIGNYAGINNSGDLQTVLGYEAGYENTGSYQTAIGYQAGYANTGTYQTAIGHFAGWDNEGENQTAIGYGAGYDNTGHNLVAIGYAAGNSNTLDNQFIVKHSVASATPLIQGNFQSGSIGIGLALPQANLHVAGNIWASGSNGNITASANISASGKLYGGLTNQHYPNTVFYNTSSGELTYGKNNLFTTPITASGGITSSGTIQALHITASGNIKAIGTVTATAATIDGTVTANYFVGNFKGTLTKEGLSNTLTLPDTTDTLVGRTTTDTLTNKTLTAPVIGSTGATFSGSTSGGTTVVATAVAGNTTLTLPARTDTLVGRATNDTFTGLKTFSSAITASIISASGTITANSFVGALTGNAATATKIDSITNDNIVQLTGEQTLTFKTLFRPTIEQYAAFEGSTSGRTYLSATAVASNNTLTLPTVTDTLVGRATTDTFTGRKTFSSAITASNISASGTITANSFVGALTGNAATATKIATITNNNIVQLDAEQTLTNKDLIAPTIESGGVFRGSTSGGTIVVATAVAGNTTLTLPAATDTLVGRTTNDTFTGLKTFSSAITASIISASGTITANSFVGSLTGNASTATSATSATSATTAATVTEAAQPSITSVGTLTTLNVSGHITASNISASGYIYGRQFEQFDSTVQTITIDTSYVYLPLGGQSILEQTSPTNANVQKLALVPGKPRKVIMRVTSAATGLETTGFTCSYHSAVPGTGTVNLIGEKYANSLGTSHEVVTFDFTTGINSGSWSDVTPGSRVYLSLKADTSLDSINALAVTSLWEWDYNA